MVKDTKSIIDSIIEAKYGAKSYDYDVDVLYKELSWLPEPYKTFY